MNPLIEETQGFLFLFFFSLYDAMYVPVIKHIHNIPCKRQT